MTSKVPSESFQVRSMVALGYFAFTAAVTLASSVDESCGRAGGVPCLPEGAAGAVPFVPVLGAVGAAVEVEVEPEVVPVLVLAAVEVVDADWTEAAVVDAVPELVVAAFATTAPPQARPTTRAVPARV